MMIRGFGGTIDSLNQADFTFSHYNYADLYYVYADTVNESHTTGGDSGAAWTINKDGSEEIFAIHQWQCNELIYKWNALLTVLPFSQCRISLRTP
ncbi:hypothetical protein QYZ39_25750 [Vibrio parahaemolyticus]|nr:hypothetical protein [Vibrio parahaemolyticus]